MDVFSALNLCNFCSTFFFSFSVGVYLILIGTSWIQNFNGLVKFVLIFFDLIFMFFFFMFLIPFWRRPRSDHAPKILIIFAVSDTILAESKLAAKITVNVFISFYGI